MRTSRTSATWNSNPNVFPTVKRYFRYYPAQHALSLCHTLPFGADQRKVSLGPLFRQAWRLHSENSRVCCSMCVSKERGGVFPALYFALPWNRDCKAFARVKSGRHMQRARVDDLIRSRANTRPKTRVKIIALLKAASRSCNFTRNSLIVFCDIENLSRNLLRGLLNFFAGFLIFKLASTRLFVHVLSSIKYTLLHPVRK